MYNKNWKEQTWGTKLALIVGIYLIIDTLRMVIIGGYDSSKLFSALFGCGLIAYILLYNFLKKRQRFLAKILLSLFIAFAVSFVVVEGLLISKTLAKVEKGDAIIVLGAALVGEEPSVTLRQRLHKAYEFMLANPEAIAVLSGGQGPKELVSEAEAMSRYLMRMGVAQERLLLEEQSTDTYENFVFSKKILDEYFDGKDYQAVFVTNGFHIYRSGTIAAMIGLPAKGLAAPTMITLAVNYYIREYCSLVYLWLFK